MCVRLGFHVQIFWTSGYIRFQTPSRRRARRNQNPPTEWNDWTVEPAFAESNAKDVGKTFEVLAEGVSKRSKEQLFGRTEQNKVVVFDRGNHRIGDFVK